MPFKWNRFQNRSVKWGEEFLNAWRPRGRERTQPAEQSLLRNSVCPRRRKAERAPWRVPADGPYWGKGAARPLDLHFLLAIFVPYADNSIEHPQSQVLTIICPAAAGDLAAGFVLGDRLLFRRPQAKVIGGTRCKLVGNRVVGDTLDRIIMPGK